MHCQRILRLKLVKPYVQFNSETIKSFANLQLKYFRNVRVAAFSTTIINNEPQNRNVNKDRKSEKPKGKRFKNKNIFSKNSEISASKCSASVFRPVVVKPDKESINFGEEFTGKLDKQLVLRQLNNFGADAQIKLLAKEHGLEGYLYNQTYSSFRRFCLATQYLPTDLHVLLSDIIQGSGHNHDLFPYFLSHAKKVFPHLDCLEDLKLISDLTDPPNWYPEAREMDRKIIFHAGPTNSGKTYHALERFMTAKSGIYCGPLKLLAVEVNNKCKTRGVPCDLVTGEERKMCSEDGTPSDHVACTVEMSNLSQKYEVAVIDEIQVIKDYQRGWAWSRALLGLQADEIHVCGEAAAIDLVMEMMISVGEEVEVRNYNRLTKLIIQDKGLGGLENTQPGDCIVCFSKQDIYSISRTLENLGKEVAVIYGSLPPNTKLAMANKFNDPKDPCKIMVATDAIGMGLNLNIRRVIFASVTKIQLSEDGTKITDFISVSQALQIAGRAGRYGTVWDTGYVTTLKDEDLPTLKELLSQTPDSLLQAGLHPTFDQIEMYAYHLPAASLSNLVDIFISLSTLDDSLYTLCHLDDFKYLADMIENIPLQLKAKYTFCCAPISRRVPFVSTMFVKIARQYSKGDLVTFDWLCTQIGWPFSPPNTILDLVHLEAVHDVFDIYLWLSYRFTDMFPDVYTVRQVQGELDKIIEQGVVNLVELLNNDENKLSTKEDSNQQVKKEVMKDNTEIIEEERDQSKSEVSNTSTIKSTDLEKLLKSYESEGLTAVDLLDKLFVPGATFNLVSTKGSGKETLFVLSATVDEHTEYGAGKSKKLAKIEASKKLLELLGKVLPEEEYSSRLNKLLEKSMKRKVQQNTNQ